MIFWFENYSPFRQYPKPWDGNEYAEKGFLFSTLNMFFSHSHDEEKDKIFVLGKEATIFGQAKGSKNIFELPREGEKNHFWNHLFLHRFVCHKRTCQLSFDKPLER